jgi:hypothetical protein
MVASEVQAFIFRAGDDGFYRVGRTLRSLRAAGIQARGIEALAGRTIGAFFFSGRIKREPITVDKKVD